MESRIRDGAPGDADAVVALWSAAGAEPTVSDDAESVRRLIADNPGALIVAEVRGLVIGTLIAAWDGWRASMYRLAVHPDHRRQGTAAALVAEGEQRLAARGCPRITAMVRREAGPAAAFWSSAGYAEQTETARYVKTSTA